MNVKPALLLVGLSAALATWGCEQQSASSGPASGAQTSNAGQASGQMAANAGLPKVGPVTDQAKASDAGQASSPMAANAGPSAQEGANAGDAAITAKVEAAILAEPGLKSVPIHVDTKDATVTLTGNVSSPALRERVKQIAMSTEGVKNVVDNLSVRPS